MLQHLLVVRCLVWPRHFEIVLVLELNIHFLMQGRGIVADEALGTVADDLVMRTALADSHNLLVVLTHSAMVVSQHGRALDGPVLAGVVHLQLLG